MLCIYAVCVCGCVCIGVHTHKQAYIDTTYKTKSDIEHDLMCCFVLHIHILAILPHPTGDFIFVLSDVTKW